MIRMDFALVAVAFGFVLGVGARAVKDELAPPPENERTVYCPIGTADPECVAARRRYESGKVSSSRTP